MIYILQSGSLHAMGANKTIPKSSKKDGILYPVILIAKSPNHTITNKPLKENKKPTDTYWKLGEAQKDVSFSVNESGEEAVDGVGGQGVGTVVTSYLINKHTLTTWWRWLVIWGGVLTVLTLRFHPTGSGLEPVGVEPQWTLFIIRSRLLFYFVFRTCLIFFRTIYWLQMVLGV